VKVHATALQAVDVRACASGNTVQCGGADSSNLLTVEEMTRPEASTYMRAPFLGLLHEFSLLIASDRQNAILLLRNEKLVLVASLLFLFLLNSYSYQLLTSHGHSLHVVTLSLVMPFLDVVICVHMVYNIPIACCWSSFRRMRTMISPRLPPRP
jgi:hypothetical protein